MRTAALIALAVALVAAPAAQAKEITKARVCGVDGCATTRDPVVLQALMNGGPPTVPPSPAGGVIRVRATVAEPDGTPVGEFTSWWVPSARMLVAEDGTWMRMSSRSRVAIERVASRFEPFPGSKIGLSDEPAPAPAPAAHDSGGGPSWPLIALLGAAIAAGALLALRRLPLPIVRARGGRPDHHRLRPRP
jgi:hypothetical protein